MNEKAVEACAARYCRARTDRGRTAALRALAKMAPIPREGCHVVKIFRASTNKILAKSGRELTKPTLTRRLAAIRQFVEDEKLPRETIRGVVMKARESLIREHPGPRACSVTNVLAHPQVCLLPNAKRATVTRIIAEQLEADAKQKHHAWSRRPPALPKAPNDPSYHLFRGKRRNLR